MEKVQLKKITTIINGSTPSTANPNNWDGDIPWITPKDLSTFHQRFIHRGERNITEAGYKSCSTTMVPKGTVLLTSRAPIGYLAIADNPMCTNQGFKSLVCDESQIIPLYLYYWLSTKVEYLKGISGGATFKELSKTTLENVEVALPSIAEQRHIVGTIGSVDDLIEKNIQISNKVMKHASLLFISQAQKVGTQKLHGLVSFDKGKKPEPCSTQGGLPYLTIDYLMGNSESTNSSTGIECHSDDVLMVMDGASSGKVFTGFHGYVGSTLAKLVTDIPSSLVYLFLYNH